jgi:hypothetical protein
MILKTSNITRLCFSGSALSWDNKLRTNQKRSQTLLTCQMNNHCELDCEQSNSGLCGCLCCFSSGNCLSTSSPLLLPSCHKAAVLRAAAKDQPGLEDVSQSSFIGKSFKFHLPWLVLIHLLTTREILLVIPSEKLIHLCVTNLLGVMRKARKEKRFEHLLTAMPKDIGAAHAKTLPAVILGKTKEVFGRAPAVARLLFLARLAVACKFHCDLLAIALPCCFRTGTHFNFASCN